MRSFFRLTLVQLKLFLREPAAFFFTLAFPLLLLLLFGIIFGNEPQPAAAGFGPDGFGYIDAEVPALTALIIGTVALLGIPIATATAREQRVLRRFRATPMQPWTYLAADVVVYFILALMGMVLLVVVGRLVYNLRFDGALLALLAGFSLSTLAFVAVGYLIASLAATARVAQVVGNLFFFPMMFLSGAAIPLQFIPESVRRVSDWFPMTLVVKLLHGLWFGEGWNWTAVVILVGMLIAGTVLSVRTFRWE